MCWERGHHPPHTESPSHLNRVSAGGPVNGIICIYHAMSLMCVFIVALFIPKLLLPFSPCPPLAKQLQQKRAVPVQWNRNVLRSYTKLHRSSLLCFIYIMFHTWPTLTLWSGSH